MDSYSGMQEISYMWDSETCGEDTQDRNWRVGYQTNKKNTLFLGRINVFTAKGDSRDGSFPVAQVYSSFFFGNGSFHCISKITGHNLNATCKPSSET